uniref:Solute carrier family 2 (Facilitated glucose transporter), member 13 n=1 Tax=Nothobranchius kuhntae TaxID=321403 RepID=A0A1A8J2B7_NOTKU
MNDRMSSRRLKAEHGEWSLIGPPSGGDTSNLLDQNISTPYFIYVLAFFSALGGFLFGYDTGVVSGAMLPLKREMNLNALWQELLVSSTVGAAALSALSGGYLNGWLGRRICILVASFIFSVGGIVLSLAQDKVVLLVGRVTVGLGIGIASMTVPVYIAEVSPHHMRGQLVTINSLFITTGRQAGDLVGCCYFSHQLCVYLGWSVACGKSGPQETGPGESFRYWLQDDKQAIWLAAATSATNFVFTLVGVWLVEKVGRRKLVLGSLLGTGLSLTLLAVSFLLSAQNSPPVTFHPYDPQNSTCRQYGSCELCMLDPNCGFCYRENGTVVFESSCVPVNLASTDHAAWGRCSNSTEGSDNLIWAYNYCPTSYSWVVLMGLVLYLASFAPGMGPMPWTVNSEIYPLWARSTGNACSAAANWIFNVLVSLTFLHVAQFLTYYGAFFMYTGLVVLALLFVFACLPETKGLQLEDIENLFTGQLCSCRGSAYNDMRRIHYIRVKGSNCLQSDNEASDVE